jgi:hypothetical protein
MMSQEPESKDEKNPQTTKSISALPENVSKTPVSGGPTSDIKQLLLRFAQRNQEATRRHIAEFRRQNEEFRGQIEESLKQIVDDRDRRLELIFIALSTAAQESDPQPYFAQRPDDGYSTFRAINRDAPSLEEFHRTPTVLGPNALSTASVILHRSLELEPVAESALSAPSEIATVQSQDIFIDILAETSIVHAKIVNASGSPMQPNAEQLKVDPASSISQFMDPSYSKPMTSVSEFKLPIPPAISLSDDTFYTQMAGSAYHPRKPLAPIRYVFEVGIIPATLHYLLYLTQSSECHFVVHMIKSIRPPKPGIYSKSYTAFDNGLAVSVLLSIIIRLASILSVSLSTAVSFIVGADRSEIVRKSPLQNSLSWQLSCFPT